MAVQDTEAFHYVPVTLDFATLNPRSPELLAVLAKVRDNWFNTFDWDLENLDTIDITLKPIEDGLTNHLYSCWPNRIPDDKLVIRINGSKSQEEFIDRTLEMNIMLQMSEKGLGPRIYARFENGLCYEFIGGGDVTIQEVRLDPLVEQIAAKMALMHSIGYNTSAKQAKMLQRLQYYLDSIPDSYFSDSKYQE